LDISIEGSTIFTQFGICYLTILIASGMVRAINWILALNPNNAIEI